MCVFLCLVISTSHTPFHVEQTSFGKINKSNLGKILRFSQWYQERFPEDWTQFQFRFR